MTVKELKEQKRELKEMDKFIKRVSSNKKLAISFLKSAGIIDSSGKLSKIYR